MIGRSGERKNILFVLFLFAYLVVVSTVQAESEIYKYVDSNGVLHFTNVPVASDNRIYIWKETFSTWSTDRYDALIAAAARENNIPFPLLKALMKVESDFNPSAISRAGARGLMQIMPATAKDLGISKPFDPDESIKGGARYLRRLLTIFDDKLPLALAAYNAGPGVVSRFKRIPPIQETQKFVRKVMHYYQAFKQDRYIPFAYP
jgi:soluble lytic murein transglycosylase